ncbi:hypothetical protein G3I60_05100 [Streptomyces sp. SID13666]|uniref:hypothetical protein n=1 Tax=Streptomyces sp. SID13666 TaxID=2706054 RepID=UPI0013BF89E4|nr:hypothetical protein [Streptomyces sp. SID13666]NEA53547.1 hypothetical protein [Streptomyces sp. SID13666]
MTITAALDAAPGTVRILARHYYEARRQILMQSGDILAPWYTLTEPQRAAAEREALVILEAIRRLEAEQAACEKARTVRPRPPLASVLIEDTRLLCDA